MYFPFELPCWMSLATICACLSGCYVYVHVYMHICMYMCMYMSRYMLMYMFMCICVCKCVYLHVNVCTYMYCDWQNKTKIIFDVIFWKDHMVNFKMEQKKTFLTFLVTKLWPFNRFLLISKSFVRMLPDLETAQFEPKKGVSDYQINRVWNC